MGWLRKRLKEKSTYRGLAILASVAGVGISPDLLEVILMSAAGAMGLIEVVSQEVEKELSDKVAVRIKTELEKKFLG